MSSVAEQLTSTLEGEYAATFAYGLIGAHVEGADVDRAKAALAAHENSRDRLRESLIALQADVPVPEPAYEAAPPVVDTVTAKRLAISVETRLTQQWSALAALSGGGSRLLAALSAQECAVRAMAWGDTPRASAGSPPMPPDQPPS